ncbi:reverse transcriptase [Plakobranchus ocellatus]|uniref:Reverse transcriptase n=1 Tax=Plakobranchus ocellatus TaxID=259542 RepID=A0AAV3Z8J0_9GAST|nr:reverse transcriptase [Plakobranchus ocellatus]
MSELDLYAKYLDLGVKLGRSGEDLATWVEDRDEALSIFLSLSPEEGSDYQAVKRVSLQRFGCDRNGFRFKFLSVKPQEAEDFGTFINRARRYFDRDRNKSNVASKNVGQGHFRPSSSSGTVLAPSHSNVTCFQCGGRGHVRRECPSRPKEANSASLVPELPSHCCAAKMDCKPRGGLKIESCKVFDRVSTLLRDSGCDTVGVSKSLVPPDCYTGKSMLVNIFCCKNKLFPTCIINIKTPYFSGDVEACLLDSPIADVILGNINGLSSESPPFDSNSSDVFPNSSIACVVTRAQASKASIGNDLPISNNSTHFNVLDPFSDLPVRQREDASIKLWFQRVGLPPVAGVSFRIEDRILKRLHAKSEFSSVQTTIAVPESLRQVVLSYAHESDLSGHSGFRKTLSAICDYFTWPGVCSDVKNYITSCHLCEPKPRPGRNRLVPFKQNRIRKGWRIAQKSVRDSAETTAYVSAISEEDGGEIGSLVATPPLASESGTVVIDPSLSNSQVQDVKELLLEFQDILTSAPGCTNTLCHEIRLTTDDVIRVKPYPLPFAARDFVTQEVNHLLSLGVIEPSDRLYCFPIVVVKKKDGSMRLCIDFRKLNAVTVFDAENVPRQEDLFNQLSHATIFSSCDLCKAYWQVPLHPDSRNYTAFQTPLGLMQWVRMPFGLVTAPATFCRLMRLVIGQTPDLLSYFDDTLVFATSWQQHNFALRTLLTLLRRHGLHVNPSKLSIASSSDEFLGHMVSSGTFVPVQKKMDKILQLSVPVKKKEVRSLLGLVNYFRHFIANFALISAPLSDLLRKGTPEKVQWTPRCD